MRKLAKQVACMGPKTCPANKRCIVCESNDPLCVPGRQFRCEDPCKSFVNECKSNEACVVKHRTPLCKDACTLTSPRALCRSRQRPFCVGVNHRPACFSVCAKGGGNAACQKTLPGSKCTLFPYERKKAKNSYFCFDPCTKCVKKPFNGCDLKTMKCIDPCKALGALPPNKAFRRWGFGRFGACRIEDLCPKGNRCAKNARRAKQLGLECTFQSKNKLCQTACIPKLGQDGASASKCLNPCDGAAAACGGNATLACIVDLTDPSLPRPTCAPACDERNYPCPDPKNPKGSGNLCKPDGHHGHQCISACGDPSYNADRGEKLCKDLLHPWSIYMQNRRGRRGFFGSQPQQNRRRIQHSRRHSTSKNSHKKKARNRNKVKKKNRKGSRKSKKKAVKVSSGPVCQNVPGKPLIQLCDLCSRSTCPGPKDPKDHTQCKIVVRLNRRTRQTVRAAKCVNPCQGRHNPCAFPYFGSPTDTFACTARPMDDKGKAYHCNKDLCRNAGGRKKCSENKYKVLCIRNSTDSQKSKCVNPCSVMRAGQKACPAGTKCVPDHWGAQLTDPKHFKCVPEKRKPKKKRQAKRKPTANRNRQKQTKLKKRQKRRVPRSRSSATNFTSVNHVLNSH